MRTYVLYINHENSMFITIPRALRHKTLMKVFLSDLALPPPLAGGG